MSVAGILTSRLNRIRNLARTAGIDAVFLLPGPNMRYLTDYTAIALERLIATVFLAEETKGPVFVILPRLEEERAEREIKLPGVEVVTYSDDQGPEEVLERVISDLNVRRLGVEGAMPYRLVKMIQKILPEANLVEIDELMTEIRIRKDEEELRRMKKASEINVEALMSGIAAIRPGITERDLKKVIEDVALNLGAENVPFCLVQSGPRSSMPHADTSTRRISDGDVVVIDVGAIYEGYVSDITRTVAVGSPTGLQERVYEIVKEAQERAISAIRPGVPAAEIDRAARKAIIEKGYGEYFIHRTGHGIGIEIHEEPYIREGNERPLEEGMTFTVEPGIYLPGKFGIRIEDNVVVTKHGLENLTKLPKSLEGV